MKDCNQPAVATVYLSTHSLLVVILSEVSCQL